MTSKSTSEAYSSSGRHWAAFPSSPLVAFASTASAAAAHTVAWSLEGNLAASVFHVSSFPVVRYSASWFRAATLAPPAWLHADDARSSCSSSEASWAASRCLQSPPLVNAINRGSRGNMSPISTNANLYRLLIRSSSEWSRGGMRYHSLIACRSELGVAESRFDLCSPKAWLRTPRT